MTAHDRQQLVVFYLIIFFKDSIYSATKKNEITPFAATKMGPEIIILSEVRKKETNVHDATSTWNLKKKKKKKGETQRNLFTKQK